MTMQEEAVLARSKERCGGLIDDVVQELHWWACFKPEKAFPPESAEAFRTLADQRDSGTVVRLEPKVGRHAPCPCGSGKKYKKCCGR